MNQKDNSPNVVISDRTREIFRSVLDVLLNAEEQGGPDGIEYIALMRAISAECKRREANYEAVSDKDANDALVAALENYQQWMELYAEFKNLDHPETRAQKLLATGRAALAKAKGRE